MKSRELALLRLEALDAAQEGAFRGVISVEAYEDIDAWEQYREAIFTTAKHTAKYLDARGELLANIFTAAQHHDLNAERPPGTALPRFLEALEFAESLADWPLSAKQVLLTLITDGGMSPEDCKAAALLLDCTQ